MEFYSLNGIFWISLLFSGFTWIYFFQKRKNSYWSDRGIPGPAPLPLIGNFHTKLFSDITEVYFDWSKKYGSLYGYYQATEPCLVVNDPELIKQVLVKDFQHFVDRFNMPIYHEMWNQMMFFAVGEQWRRVRTIASGTFTSGKLRGMHGLIGKCVEKLDQHLDNLVDSSEHQGVIQVKKIISGFTIDVIASTVFAVEIDVNSGRPEDLKFAKHGKNMVDFPIARLLGMSMLPITLLNAIGIDSPFEPEAFDYFIKLTRHILQERRRSKVKLRNDLVQLLLDASVEEDVLQNKGNYEKLAASDEVEADEVESTNKSGNSKKHQLTDSEMIANMIIFFIAGFETTAATISHCLFLLTHNLSIQERLHQELIKSLDNLSSESLEYTETILTGIPYLEAVIKETLRIYSPVNELNRLCQTEGYQLGKLKLRKHENLFISTAAFHLNPEYYPEPNIFKPERFLPENAHLLVPYTYLPFGTGPRNCIGMRFAYQEIKMVMAMLSLKYRFDVTENTPTKLTFKKGKPLKLSEPFEIQVQRR